MSLSRKNWKALSSLTRQWTLEDEEEVERERRRRVRGSSSTADPDSPGTDSPSRDAPIYCSPPVGAAPEKAQNSSAEPGSEDFVEMLQVRDERRRLRHVETLRRQRAEEDGEEVEGAGGRARVELLGDSEEEEGDGATKGGRLAAVTLAATKVSRVGPPVSLRSNGTRGSTTSGTPNRQHGNGDSTRKVPDENPSSPSSRKFVSSVCISLDSCTSPTEKSPRPAAFGPTPPASPGQPWGSPCHSPSPRGPQSPIHNGFTTEAAVNSSPSADPANGNQTNRPSLGRQSSRTTSFRMLKKKSGEAAPIRRSSSVRLTSQKFESNADPNQEDEKTSNFQRNTRQRVSSHSIQEKMERLAQASQKPEVSRFPDVTQRTLVLLEEVSRKRDLFEKEHQASSPTSPGVSRQEFRTFTSGISDRINRWVHKSTKPGSSPNPADLRHVDISSKKILFESKHKE
ncbi:ladinin-1 [Gadus chalcogrammus]|uniref:ladinin-1 n=1 Tax=Gadus chalcogrammus TaxID=1042646 RepID=UPI0024C33F4B|nr:ladinin-1 [Gadus chalcogrammus]